MASVAVWDAALSARVPEHVDEAEVIASGNQGLGLVHVHTVDVCAIGSPREHAVDEPAEFAVLGGPDGTSGIGGSGGILVAGRHEEEEKLVCIAHGSNVRAVRAPIYASEGGIVLLASSDEGVTVLHIVNVNVGIVRAGGQVLATGTVLRALDPLQGVRQLLHGLGEPVEASNCDGAIVGANGDVAVHIVHRNSSGALTVWLASQGTGAVSPGLSRRLVHVCGANALPQGWVPLLDLIVVTCGVDAGRVDVEAPDLAIIVALHDRRQRSSCDVALHNGSSPETHDKLLTVVAVDGPRKRTEVEGLQLLHAGRVRDDDSAISSSGVELALAPHDGANETFAVVAKGLLDGVAGEDVDERIAASSVGGALVIRRHAGEAASWVRPEESLLLSLGLDRPVSEVLLSRREDFYLAWMP